MCGTQSGNTHGPASQNKQETTETTVLIAGLWNVIVLTSISIGVTSHHLTHLFTSLGDSLCTVLSRKSEKNISDHCVFR